MNNNIENELYKVTDTKFYFLWLLLHISFPICWNKILKIEYFNQHLIVLCVMLYTTVVILKSKYDNIKAEKFLKNHFPEEFYFLCNNTDKIRIHIPWGRIDSIRYMENVLLYPENYDYYLFEFYDKIQIKTKIVLFLLFIGFIGLFVLYFMLFGGC